MEVERPWPVSDGSSGHGATEKKSGLTSINGLIGIYLILFILHTQVKSGLERCDGFQKRILHEIVASGTFSYNMYTIVSTFHTVIFDLIQYPS